MLKVFWSRASTFYLSRVPFALFADSPKTHKKQKTLYQILEVPTTATQGNIRKNYLKLAKVYHPDVYRGSDKNRFALIQQAYKVLSDRAKRNSYNQKIGIKKSQPETAENVSKKPSETVENEQQYGRKKNEFTYEQIKAKTLSEMDMDKEYEQFFNQKNSTHFEEIRLHEQRQFKQMSMPERVRRRFVQLYEDNMTLFKMGFQKPYPEMLDDKIDQLNEHERQARIKMTELQRQYSEDVVKRKIRFMKIVSVLGFVCLIPVIISIETKRRLQMEIMQAIRQKQLEMQHEIQLMDVKMRLGYD